MAVQQTGRAIYKLGNGEYWNKVKGWNQWGCKNVKTHRIVLRKLPQSAALTPNFFTGITDIYGYFLSLDGYSTGIKNVNQCPPGKPMSYVNYVNLRGSYGYVPR